MIGSGQAKRDLKYMRGWLRTGKDLKKFRTGKKRFEIHAWLVPDRQRRKEDKTGHTAMICGMCGWFQTGTEKYDKSSLAVLLLLWAVWAGLGYPGNENIHVVVK